MPNKTKTRSGKEVFLGTSYRVPGGWVSYVLHSNGYAVACFVPAA